MEQTIRPVRLTSGEFGAVVGRMPGDRAKASAMQHALLHHIDLHIGENPVAYDKLRRSLEKVLEDHADNWAKQVEAFDGLTQEARDITEGRHSELPEDVRALTRVEQAVYQQLTTVLTDGVVADEVRGELVGLAQQMRTIAVRHGARKDLFQNPAALHDLQSDIWMALAVSDLTSASADSLAPAVREIIQHNRRDL